MESNKVRVGDVYFLPDDSAKGSHPIIIISDDDNGDVLYFRVSNGFRATGAKVAFKSKYCYVNVSCVEHCVATVINTQSYMGHISREEVCALCKLTLHRIIGDSRKAIKEFNAEFDESHEGWCDSHGENVITLKPKKLEDKALFAPKLVIADNGDEEEEEKESNVKIATCSPKKETVPEEVAPAQESNVAMKESDIINKKILEMIGNGAVTKEICSSLHVSTRRVTLVRNGKYEEPKHKIHKGGSDAEIRQMIMEGNTNEYIRLKLHVGNHRVSAVRKTIKEEELNKNKKENSIPSVPSSIWPVIKTEYELYSSPIVDGTDRYQKVSFLRSTYGDIELKKLTAEDPDEIIKFLKACKDTSAIMVDSVFGIGGRANATKLLKAYKQKIQEA